MPGISSLTNVLQGPFTPGTCHEHTKINTIQVVLLKDGWFLVWDSFTEKYEGGKVLKSGQKRTNERERGRDGGVVVVVGGGGSFIFEPRLHCITLRDLYRSWWTSSSKWRRASRSCCSLTWSIFSNVAPSSEQSTSASAHISLSLSFFPPHLCFCFISPSQLPPIAPPPPPLPPTFLSPFLAT